MIGTYGGRLSTLALASGLMVALAGQAAAQRRETISAPVVGVYVGIFAGAVALDSTINLQADGTRPGAKLVDQGGDGAIVGLRTGWGTLVSQHVYTGLELEGVVPIDANSRYDVNGLRYRRRLQNEVGAYGRVGWSPDGYSLLFLRGGLAVPLTTVDQRVIAIIGAGAEVPFGRRFAGRVDISYSFPSGGAHLETYRLTAGVVLRF
jgi:hypothetical protein